MDNENNVPSHTVEALDRYWQYGYAPGGFLTNLLEGNIYLAILRADRWNKDALGHIVEYILHKAPPGSYGSANLVQDWINHGVAFEQHQKQRVVDILSIS
jgi:hypothetical protein